MGERGHKHCAVDIGGYDVGLLAEVDGTPDDVVAPWLYGCYVGSAVGAWRRYGHDVAYGDGVGGAQSADAEIAFHFAVDFSGRCFHHIVCAGVAYNAACCFVGLAHRAVVSSHPLCPKWCSAVHWCSLWSTIQWHVAMLSIVPISWLTSRIVARVRSSRRIS